MGGWGPRRFANGAAGLLDLRFWLDRPIVVGASDAGGRVVGSNPDHEGCQQVRAARQPNDREAAEPNRRGFEEGRRRLVTL
jgi:hypothetical protein